MLYKSITFSLLHSTVHHHPENVLQDCLMCAFSGPGPGILPYQQGAGGKMEIKIMIENTQDKAVSGFNHRE